MKKSLDLRELSDKACDIAAGSDFKIYTENGYYCINTNDTKDLKYETIEELSDYIESFDEACDRLSEEESL